MFSPSCESEPKLAITHPFKPGARVQACRVTIASRPHFFPATIVKAVPHVADLYQGCYDGEQQVRRFFAHPTWQDAQSEAALLLHFRASLAPELFYAFDASLLSAQGRR